MLRILVDESLPHQLADELPGFEVATVRGQRWSRLRNGVLLRAAVDAGFDLFLTADRSFPRQQNLRAIGIAVVVITGVRNRIKDLRPLIPQIVAASDTVKRGESIEVRRSAYDSIRDDAGIERPNDDRSRKLAVLRAATQHSFPTAGIDELNEQIERGYRREAR